MAHGTPQPLSWAWGDGFVLSGTVPGVHLLPDGTRAIVHVGTAPHALDDTALAQVQLWLLAACTPGHAVTSWWIGSKEGKAGADGVKELGTYATRGECPLAQREAHVQALKALLPLYREALAAPRPRFGKTAEQVVTDRVKAAKTFGQLRGRLVSAAAMGHADTPADAQAKRQAARVWLERTTPQGVSAGPATLPLRGGRTRPGAFRPRPTRRW
jgi:hypothetical protein